MDLWMMVVVNVPHQICEVVACPLLLGYACWHGQCLHRRQVRRRADVVCTLSLSYCLSLHQKKFAIVSTIALSSVTSFLLGLVLCMDDGGAWRHPGQHKVILLQRKCVCCWGKQTEYKPKKLWTHMGS